MISRSRFCPPRREVSASGIPIIAKAKQAKGIENFLWISTIARRRRSGETFFILRAVSRSSRRDCARSPFSYVIRSCAVDSMSSENRIRWNSFRFVRYREGLLGSTSWTTEE